MALLELRALQAGGLAPWSLQLEAGQCLLLSGASGSGKSRLLRAIADLDPHGGEALLAGQACHQTPPTQWRREVGLLAAESGWWQERVGAHFDVEPDEAMFTALGFGLEVLGWELSRCSTGERQRLALLRLLQRRPRLLLLDEPTASLDPENVARVERLLLAYLASEQAAAIWVSHDPQQMARVASRRCTITQGRIHEESL